MEKEVIDNIMYKANQLMRNEEFINAKIEYVLVNVQNPEHSIVEIIDKNNELYEVNLKNNEINPELDWAYNIDDNIFSLLEQEYEIGFMELELHLGIWQQFKNLDIEEFNHQLGLQKYIKYCKENNIDQKTICESFNADVPDIMQYYNEKTDYITINNGQVQLPQEIYQRDSEINYIAFCLGYDLLNNKLSTSEKNECDNVYDFCNYLAKKFIKTEYYKNAWRSTYDNLVEWLDDNKEIIQSEYLTYLERDNKTILEIGNRGETKVALVERITESGRDYIVAFNYSVDDKKVGWGYGYYYDKDFEKAKEDFEKVKAGGNLADTFEENKTKKNKERER